MCSPPLELLLPVLVRSRHHHNLRAGAPPINYFPLVLRSFMTAKKQPAAVQMRFGGEASRWGSAENKDARSGGANFSAGNATLVKMNVFAQWPALANAPQSHPSDAGTGSSPMTGKSAMRGGERAQTSFAMWSGQGDRLQPRLRRSRWRSPAHLPETTSLRKSRPAQSPESLCSEEFVLGLFP